MILLNERRLRPLAEAVKSAYVTPVLNVAWIIEHERKHREARRLNLASDYPINSALE
jgi:hypothetical protein